MSRQINFKDAYTEATRQVCLAIEEQIKVLEATNQSEFSTGDLNFILDIMEKLKQQFQQVSMAYTHFDELGTSDV